MTPGGADRRTAVRSLGPVVVLAGVVAVLVALLTFGWLAWRSSRSAGQPPAKTVGVRSYDIDDRRHVAGTVRYEVRPPVGGAHAPTWQPCGFYAAPVANEEAVHSMEHGAAWITYDPELPASEVASLRALAEEPYTLVSPYDDLPTAVVVSSWGRQLRLASVGDPRLADFLDEFRDSAEAPEPGGPCDEG